MIVCDGWEERRPWRARLAAIASAAVILWIAAPGAAYADTCTWTGAGPNDLWSTPANWACSGAHVVPVDGDALVFPSAVPRFEPVNDLIDLIVDSLTIEDQQYQLSGNRIFLEQHLTSSPSVTGQLSVAFSISLNQPGTQIVVSDAGAELTLTGAVTAAPVATLVKNGAGALTLSNPANAWPSAAITAGVLRLGASGVLPDGEALSVHGTLDLNGYDEAIGSLAGSSTGTVALGNNTLTVTQTANANFNGVITGAGAGGFTKAGGAALTLDGGATNTFTGTTTVTAGELRLAKNPIAQAISGSLVVNGGAVFTNRPAQIGDTVPVTINAPGQLTLDGGGGGILENIGSLAGGGTVTLTNYNLNVGFNNESTVFTGTIGGTGAIFGKWGTGTLTLTGTHALSSTTTVADGGGLIVNGSLPNRVFVSSGLIGEPGPSTRLPRRPASARSRRAQLQEAPERASSARRRWSSPPP